MLNEEIPLTVSKIQMFIRPDFKILKENINMIVHLLEESNCWLVFFHRRHCWVISVFIPILPAIVSGSLRILYVVIIAWLFSWEIDLIWQPFLGENQVKKRNTGIICTYVMYDMYILELYVHPWIKTLSIWSLIFFVSSSHFSISSRG